MRTIQLLSSIVSVFLVSLTLHAADYHVWHAGLDASDDGPGTLDRPWKTITKAAATVQAGDTVFIHAGIYAEAVAVKNAGSEPRPIVFKAFGDDEVILEGADAVAGGKWQPVLDRRSIHWVVLDRDPSQLWVDGKPVYPKVDQTQKNYPRTYKLGVLTDEDGPAYQYDGPSKRLLLTLGGDAPARHDVRVPVRTSAFFLNEHCRLSGVRIRNYVYSGIAVSGSHGVVEDCLVTDCGGGIVPPI